MTDEQWVPIPFLPGYEATRSGRIRTISRIGLRGQRLTGKEIKFTLEHGYLTFRPTVDGKTKTLKVHRVIAATFIGPCPDGFHVNHKDFNKQNNSVSNLEYLSPGDNVRHAWKGGRIHPLRGSSSPSAKIDEDTVRKILDMLNDDRGVMYISRKLGIGRTAVSDIKNNKAWKHVPR